MPYGEYGKGNEQPPFGSPTGSMSPAGATLRWFPWLSRHPVLSGRSLFPAPVSVFPPELNLRQ